MTAKSDVPTGIGAFLAPQRKAPETFNVLLYAPAKSGKSTAAATAPGPILWINAEGSGALGYARKTAAERGTAIHEIVVNKKARNATHVLDEVYRHLRDGDEPRVRTVVVDTVGKLRDALVEQLVDKTSKSSLKQYGDVADKLGGFINALRDMPVNFVLIAHADVHEDDEEGRLVVPLIGGKLTETVPGEVDVVAYCGTLKTEEGVRYVGQLVEGRGRQHLGDRSGALAGDRGFRELDLSEWLEAYREALTPAAEDTSDLPFGPSEGGGGEQTLGEAA